MVCAALILSSTLAEPPSDGVKAFLAFHQSVLAVREKGGWHDPNDRSNFSTKPYPVVVAGIGRSIDGTGRVEVSKDKEWGWIADADKDLPFDQVLCYGVRPAYLRKVTDIGDPTGVYRVAAMSAFKSKGFSVEHIEEIHAYRTDLRGDAQKEVIVAAQGLGRNSPMAIIFLRQPAAKGVRTDVLEFQEMGYPRVSAIADFTGDGTMQVVIAGGISDGVMGSLWSFKAPKPKRLANFIMGE